MTTPSDPNPDGGFGDQPGYGQQPGGQGQQPGGYPTSGLPSFPAAPPPADGPTPTLTPPTSVTAAFWCFLVAAVVIVIGGILAVTAKQTVIDTLRDNNTGNLSS